MKYHLIVFGCQMNFADSQKFAGVLERAGYENTKELSEANLIAVVMCSVRQSAVDRIFGLVEKFKKLKKKPTTILTGCIIKKDRKTFLQHFDYVLSMSELLASQRTSQGNFAWLRGAKKLPRIERARAGERALAKKPTASAKGYITISNGCNNFCTYCVVPYTRGRLVCHDHKKIIEEVKDLVKREFKDIWLLGQNVNDYTSPTDKSVDFPKLVELIDALPGNFKIFFTSPNPRNFSEKLIDVLGKAKRFSRYLNLPIQSGDNEILKKMNRPYTAEQYIALVKKIRKTIPDINLSTDVIVGFPGETKKQFENTVKLFKKIKFNIAYINKYSPRRGTAASKLANNVTIIEKKRREQVLQKIIDSTKKEPR